MIRRKRGTLFVISAPSGTGKTTIIKRLLSTFDDIYFSVSYTTRPKRNGEIEGVDYVFVDEKTFKDMVEADEFLEYAVVYGNYYGTPKRPVLERIERGIDVVLDIDTAGAMSVKEKVEDTVLVFIFPPSIDTLVERLRLRGTESEEVMRKRISQAMVEIERSNIYDYWVLNDSIDRAFEELKSIVIAERCRRKRFELWGI
ncbi:MAG: guanylate kinase [Thermosulfidibacteraceae bacterium]|jgi:guanylate kinase